MGKENQKGLESLAVWQKSVQLARTVHTDILPNLPQEERWALSSQLRRSSQSIGANIAEGYGRYYYQEGIRFCYIARGSLEETYNHLYFAHEMGYLAEQKFSDLSTDIDELRRMIAGYIKYLKKSKIGAHEPGSRIYEESLTYSIIEDEPTTDPNDESPETSFPGS